MRSPSAHYGHSAHQVDNNYRINKQKKIEKEIVRLDLLTIETDY